MSKQSVKDFVQDYQTQIATATQEILSTLTVTRTRPSKSGFIADNIFVTDFKSLGNYRDASINMRGSRVPELVVRVQLFPKTKRIVFHF